MNHSKIGRTHQQRRAVVYLRQSTMKQVHVHRESTKRQYGLSERAVQLGWCARDVDVIDEDLGQSGASAEKRTGFRRLAEQVSLGRVGVIFALEVSRLARSSADWHKLLDLCGLADVLIADEHDVFAPNDPNDRLLLGLKGQMSEAEKYWMRLRLRGAQESKARRGELKLIAPTGYVWDAGAQRLEFDPDQEVQRVLRLVFERFELDGSAGAVIGYFIHHGLLLPTRRSNGDLTHQRPVLSRVLSILHSPIYAGAYVYGRHHCRAALVDGRVRSNHVVDLPREAWKVNIQDRHPAYLSWEQFVTNQDKLQDNRHRRQTPDAHGAAGQGEALLQGLLLCGRCGYRMSPQQGGGQVARYLCSAPVQKGISTKACWSVAAAAIDAAVVSQFLEAAQPPEVELSLAVTREVERQARELDGIWKVRLERARYEAQLAERRYKAVDPDNRVVAHTLEADWETKLRALGELERAQQDARREHRVDLSPADRVEIVGLARELPRVWATASTTNAQRKNMLRILIQEVAVTPIDLPRRMSRVRILWHTGAVTEMMVDRPRSRAPRTSASAVEAIRELTGRGNGDTKIAAELNRQRVPSCKGQSWTKQTVRSIRRRYAIESPNSPGRPGGSRPDQRVDGLLSMRGVARRLGISQRTIRGWVESGKLKPAEGGGHGRPLWFSLDDRLEQQLLLGLSRRSRVVSPSN